MTDTGQIPGEGLPENAGMVAQPGIPAPGAYTYLEPSENGPEEDDLLLMPGAQGAWSDPQPAQPVQQGPVGLGHGGQAPVAMPAPVAQAPGPPGAEYVAAEYHASGQFVPEHAVSGHHGSGAFVSESHAEVPAQVQAPVAQEFAAPGFAAPAFAQEQFAPAQEPVAEPVAPVHDVNEAGAHESGAHEAGGRHSGSVDLSAVRVPAEASAAPTPQPTRRPLHMGPPMPDSTGGVVRSLADRGPAGTTPPHAMRVHTPGPPTSGLEYLDIPRDEAGAVLPGPQLGEIPPQAGTPWDPQPPQFQTPPSVPAETVVPESASVAPVALVTPEAPVTPEAAAVAAPAPEPQPEAEPGESAPAGQFVPGEGSLPSPHLTPTPVAVLVEPEPAPEAVPEPAAVPEPVQPVQEVAAAVAEPEPAPEAVAPEPVPPAVAPEPAASVHVPAPRHGGSEPLAEPTAEPAAEAEPVVTPQIAEVVEVAEEAVVAEVSAPEAEPEPEPEPLAVDGAPAPGYDDAEREAVLRVMRERRDIRNGFRSDPIPHDVLLRVLEAAHTAPSVGHSQPWDFVVIRSAETRRTMHELAQRQREAYAKSLPKGRAKQFKELKIDAILDTPVNIVVTADPTRGGRHTLGRHTQPQMAPYSSALAVENLWLAARAEGLGVGWVSFFDEREMVRALGLPEHLEAVAYLCVGYVDEFPEEPELMQAGWSKRRPLSWVVHEETYGRRALPGEEPHDLLQETVSNIRPLDAKALGEAWERQKRMTKPAGALGMLEIISAQLSGLSRMCPPPIPEPAAVAIFAGDHGVHAQGVTSWPQEVTAQMVANFLGGGAVCNAFANQVGAEVCVIDVGVAGDLPATPGLLPRKVRAGTADFTTGAALTREEVLSAIEVGIETARDLVAAGNKALLTGEMGIANTTVSAALISVYTGMDPGEVTGRGTGINDEMHARKVDVVRRALQLHAPDAADAVGVLSMVGGLEHAALVGFILGGASLRTPVVLDGVSAGAAALVARAIAPEALAACIAGHRSAEPGHVAALNKLGLRPLVDLDLRLGEGTGALLALPVVQSAARAMHEVATFDSAGVTEK
ncbi:nicotinate-nucleotide--dimethylbenzimidazole phosphoribosyltransferase [Streptomyces sp. ISL-1]|uniref:nicotinate-nucleotide--dimethylbenzimidazole phosphoribosyltransferase n=1 Tax=Streptomyces sp. ISL-1 TaxID=2817657 RepID=UPI001BE50F49|nr:nicotinate-nucleotide--dimethylbenzimidazole phosphoribosyltransferase [Streptomyces sp. ISL-1]MBT2391491.1 nicotinate-nucleotide--dimethylbenzimidazole phosphoribosyltransferase [Streptomyces sp. ISL-1]